MPVLQNNSTGNALARIIWPILAGISLCFALPGINITFHEHAIVNDSSVFLRDIASIGGACPQLLEKLNEINLGRSAPPGFSRFMNKSETMRYSVQRCLNGIPCAIEGPERIEITTGSRDIRIGDIEEQLQAHIKALIQWPEGSFLLQTPDTSFMLRCFNRPYIVKFDNLDNLLPRGNVPLRLTVMQDNYRVSSTIVCRIKVTIPVVVAGRAIERGENITRDCLKTVSRDITVLRYTPYYDFEKLGSVTASRTIPAGTILHEKLLVLTPVVVKGDLVYVTADRGAVKVSVPALARENGAIGERIWVENSETHKIFQVEITGTGKAAISAREAI
jgi:flagella basal body P-ring formation protein FlgA